MDLREKRTKRNIKNAFISLRKTKALERITVKELAELADLLEGRTVKMPFYVFAAAEMKGACADAVSRIQKSGARVIPDTCMIVSPLFEKRGCVMTNSGKAFTYLPGMCDTVPRLGSLEDCVRVACGE